MSHQLRSGGNPLLIQDDHAIAVVSVAKLEWKTSNSCLSSIKTRDCHRGPSQYQIALVYHLRF
ncbi:hypothetical protein BDQ94DRAFT_155094 [Aspergillus welwitschiae]|uniref:Uncharacterized protein n=1 Tax=Aspergillus welwitschiae TaxID=1341132 RepID=A0A3F3PK38_9EURO|nr:hypothetical protein BDQ94DRAFT_155094 [Aspergillus welwitschiae]RDH26726.1 hypothetical protein BDQ94DRAFT_155094 [Aspergillus welwitschiae]